MPVPAPKGLALTGSILAIVAGALALISGITALSLGGRFGGGIFTIVGIVVAAFGVTGILLGAIGCMIKPGAILANAIVFTVLTLLGLLGIFGGNVSIMGILYLLLCAAATVFLFMGVGQAKAYQAAQRGG